VWHQISGRHFGNVKRSPAAPTRMPTRPRGCLGHWSTQFVVVHMTLVKLATVILCLPQATESNR
jgi:hypothetical protein